MYRRGRCRRLFRAASEHGARNRAGHGDGFHAGDNRRGNQNSRRRTGDFCSRNRSHRHARKEREDAEETCRAGKNGTGTHPDSRSTGRKASRTGSSADPHPHVGHFVWTPDKNRFGWRALLGVEPGGPEVPPAADPVDPS